MAVVNQATSENSTIVRSSGEKASRKKSRAPLALRLLRATLAALERLGSPGRAAAEGIVMTLFRRPKRFPRPEREARWLADAERFTVDDRPEGSRLVCWAWGPRDAPVVLLVHGWEGRAGQMGAIGQALGAAGYRAVAFDGPAHGETGGQLSSLPQLARAIRKVAEHALAAGGHERLFGIVAHSFGTLGVAWDLMHGLSLDRLVFVSPGDDMGPYTDKLARLLRLTPRLHKGWISRLERRFDISWEEARCATVGAAGHHPETPLLIVHDTEDDETPPEGAAVVERAWAKARRVTTTGLGHTRILRDGGVVSEVVEFLRGD